MAGGSLPGAFIARWGCVVAGGGVGGGGAIQMRCGATNWTGTGTGTGGGQEGGRLADKLQG